MQDRVPWTRESHESKEIDETFIEEILERKRNSNQSKESSTDSLLQLSLEEDEIIFIEDEVNSSGKVFFNNFCDNSKVIEGRVAKTIQNVVGCNYLTELLDNCSDSIILIMYEEIKDQIFFLEKHVIASKFVLRLRNFIRKIMI